ncbi:GNAT family N-acetyltransferase [Dysgonomonas sp. 511]|uniref:GNAT family N-acetyltransferase n=1 Tax=Dysgonomonas sp. 511 TaxID=2302930 RepID=UPI0013D6D31E|nr:GNAT family N-acetyltransferase [Dysgonomonas sp. 511]NDV79408.1 GNAT family N-acetyltransferase [Dysgonomonas sp. 511]
MVEYLQWDSGFFKRKIGRISITNKSNLSDLLDNARKSGYNLIYCFTKESLLIENTILDRFNGSLVDQKIIFKGITNITNKDISDIKEFEGTIVNEELLNLAYLSGSYSRYKTDYHFTEAEFKKFYRTWVENSLKKEIADKTFVAYNKENMIVGLVTVKKSIDTGTIGLIATDSSLQKRGLGRKLMNAVQIYLYNNGISFWEVATQKDNKNACDFYRKCGLTEKETNNIYHFWL